MNRISYIILLIVLIAIYFVFFVEQSSVKHLLSSILSNKEKYNNDLQMKHPNYIYNHLDALKHKFNQPGRDFTGYFTKTIG